MPDSSRTHLADLGLTTRPDQQARLLSAILDTQGALMVVLDAGGRIVRFNRACERMTGYTEAEVRGQPYDLLLLPEEAGDVHRVFQALLEGQKTNEHDNHWVSKDGQAHLVAWSNSTVFDDQGQAEFVVGIGIDITDRERAMQALAESEARAHAILDTTVDAVITIDERGQIESFNPAAERIFGYRADEAIGQNINVLMPPPYREEHDGYLQNYLETGRRKIIGIGREVRGLRKDGSVFPMDLAVSEVDLNGRKLFTGIVRDISDRRRLEQEILRASDQERRRIGQDLHDGLGQMLTGIGLISHNLARKLAARRLEGAEEASEITGLIKEADQHARNLARGLVPVELDSRGLSAALERLSGQASYLLGIRCVFEQSGSAEVKDSSVATHLYRIAQEAVSNAARHGRASYVKVSLVATGDHMVRLRIHDNGSGFDEQDTEHSGQGIRIMQHRARIIGASLEISSDPAHGTTVTCTLQRPPLQSSSHS